MEYDYSWRNPTEAQLAAWEKACDALGVCKKDREWMREHHHTTMMIEVSRRAYAVDAEIYRGPAHAMTPYTLAEMILQADSSLWYTQAKGWADGNTPFKRVESPHHKEYGIAQSAGIQHGIPKPTGPSFDVGEKFGNIFRLAGSTVVKIVDWGYQDRVWWHIPSIYGNNTGMAALGISVVIEAVRLVDEITRPRSVFSYLSAGMDSEMLYTISPGWRWFPRILLPKLNVNKMTEILALEPENGTRIVIGEIRAQFDPAFRKIWLAAKRKAEKEIAKTYEPTECIHPECKNLVAPPKIEPRDGHYKNYLGKGACCQGHNSYFCSKCKAPHSHASKIGKAHFKKYFSHDWNGLDADGNK